MNLKKIILFVALLITSHQLLVSVSYAQQTSLSVHPSIISLSLSPGKITITALSIKNNGENPLPVRLRFEPLSTLSDSSVKSLQSIGSWISISNPSLLLPANKEVKVDIKIALPKTIPLGGYYGMLYVEQLSPTQTNVDSLILTKMGVLILGSVGVQEIPLNSIELQKPLLATPISETNILQFSFDVKNTALNHITAKPYLMIHPFFGKTETVQFEEKLVFPGTKRTWNSSFTVQDSKKFYYSAELFVSIGSGLAQKKSFSFIIFPVQQAIILVLCITVSVSLYRKRKQIKKAFGIMIKG